MPQLDDRFLALPLGELTDAALTKAKELGCSHAEVRVERIRQAYRSFRDHALETTADGQVLGLSVRVVHHGVWGFASDITLSTDSAAHLAERAVATAKVSRPLTPVSVELADEEVYADVTWVSAYEMDPFDVDEATKTGRVLGLNAALLAAPGVTHANAMLGYVHAESLGGAGLTSNGKSPDRDLESFRILRANVDSLVGDQPRKTIAVTSPLEEEGKSTVAVGLATAAALADRRVLLVECDLRRPVFADRLDVPSSPGISDWATGKAQPEDVLRSVPIAATNGARPEDGGETSPEHFLTVISAGSFTAEPAELLASRRFREFLGEAREDYDLIVLDCAPVLSVGDALEVLRLVDAALLCIRLDQTTREQALAAKGAIGHMPERPIGLVLTGVRSGLDGYYYPYESSTVSRPATLVQPPGSS